MLRTKPLIKLSASETQALIDLLEDLEDPLSEIEHLALAKLKKIREAQMNKHQRNKERISK